MVQVRLLLDQDECTIEVSDSFGSLRWADLCDSLERCLKSVTPRSDLEGGAGLGLNMILHTANSLSVLVSPNEATVAIASLGRESATCCSRSGTLHFHTACREPGLEDRTPPPDCSWLAPHGPRRWIWRHFHRKHRDDLEAVTTDLFSAEASWIY